MRIIIAPAKKMVADTDSFPVDALPQFLEQAERLKAALQEMSPQALQALWKCSGSIARLNVDRLASMDLRRRLTPAVMAYEGIQYRYMAPGVMESAHLVYLRERLRVLSGFYGLLRPFDGVVPYRMEMQARLAVDGHRDLYAFWGDKLALALARETDWVLNLASKEYSRAVQAHLPGPVRLVNCVFGEAVNGKVVEKGTLCKMARGQMVRFIAEHAIMQPEGLKDFCDLGYRFDAARSGADRFVFIKEK